MADELAAMMNTELKRVIRFVKSIPGWREIPMEDQVFLIKGTLNSHQTHDVVLTSIRHNDVVSTSV